MDPAVTIAVLTALCIALLVLLLLAGLALRALLLYFSVQERELAALRRERTHVLIVGSCVHRDSLVC